MGDSPAVFLALAAAGWGRQARAGMKGLKRWLDRLLSGGAVLSAGSSRAERGQFGEDRAADYCRRELGFKLIKRNWCWKQYELDLICRDGEVLVFVEVRARAADALVGGFHSIDGKKKKALRRACRAYINQLQIRPKHFRFDVVEIVLPDEGAGDIRHYANIPLFRKHDTARS
jgi:putative endonuclease